MPTLVPPPRRSAPTRRQAVVCIGAGPLLGSVVGCSTAPPLPPLPASVVSAMAPGGRLVASINLGNPILANRGEGNSPPVGISVDLARELAARLGVAVELRVVDAAAKSVDAVRAGQADVGFFAVDPLRSDGIRFSAPYVLIEGAYLVKDGSPIRDNAEVDRPGIKVMVGRGSAYDLYLSRALKSAERLHTTTSQSVVDQFLAQNADVAAGVKQQLIADAARLPGLRLLPGRFMVIEQAMGLPAARGESAQKALREFVEWAKSSGFVARSMERHGIQGALVAPAG